jgi:hypothetical protein
VGEQKGGEYLVSETVYNLLKENKNIKKVNFAAIVKIDETKAKADVKPTPLP